MCTHMRHIEVPKIDPTLIGICGITLSGGQKHRVALARALHSRCETFVLDDIMSALDKQTTERTIAQFIFGADGLFRRNVMTVIMMTHSMQYLHLAHQVAIVPGSGLEKEQGDHEYIQQTSIFEKLAHEEIPSDASSRGDYV
ncbi:hypothetical protein BJ878DRAFT_93995 [Calycina marina]|uniref:ABC transporter domain-containing protein n=1 Tax=Calycina marina TaxID=1763456 RepID=A0A9P8CK11_9HELO|nr:hypothetical protein BJ878DRAFT_93995 [Calycina marina]